MKQEKKFISNVDYNKSSEACYPCVQECKKIDKRINKRKLSEIKDDDIDHVINVFGIKR